MWEPTVVTIQDFVRTFDSDMGKRCLPIFAPSSWKEETWWFSTSDRWAASSATAVGLTRMNIIIFCLLGRQLDKGNVRIING